MAKGFTVKASKPKVKIRMCLSGIMMPLNADGVERR